MHNLPPHALHPSHAGAARDAAPALDAVPALHAVPAPDAPPAPLAADAPHEGVPERRPDLGDEEGSLVTEYGLLAVVAATVAGAVIAWASNGALTTLFNALLRQARALVGA